MIKEIFAINAEATRLERERCLKAVDDEPEFPGEMPDEVWNAFVADRDMVTKALRLAVRQTKAGIRDRIVNPTGGSNNGDELT